MNNLATALYDEGRYVEAEKLLRETLGVRRRVLGPEHPDTLTSNSNLANTEMKMRKYTDAEKTLEDVRGIQRRVLGSDHPDTAASTYGMARSAALQGRSERAMSLLGEAIEHGLAPDLDLRMDRDPDLKSLRGNRRFDAVIARTDVR